VGKTGGRAYFPQSILLWERFNILVLKATPVQNGDSPMNPTTITNQAEGAESRTQGDNRQGQAASSSANQNATPVCNNGVCMVTWKPTKPQAA